jgi:hypothetical protein
MSQEAFVVRLAQRLEAAGIPFMVVGSLASSLHGEPRSTQDADLLIDPTPEQLGQFLQILGNDYYVSPEAARDAMRRRSMFNIIDFNEGYKADLIFLDDRPFSREEFRRRRLEQRFGHTLPFASAEDVVLAKLEWDRITPSDRQLQDVLKVLRVQWGKLDLGYLRHWAAELHVSQRLEEMLRLAETSPGVSGPDAAAGQKGP